MNNLLTSKEASKVLDYSEQTLRIWRTRKDNHLPFVKIKGRVFYRSDDLVEFMGGSSSVMSACELAGKNELGVFPLNAHDLAVEILRLRELLK